MYKEGSLSFFSSTLEMSLGFSWLIFSLELRESFSRSELKKKKHFPGLINDISAQSSSFLFSIKQLISCSFLLISESLHYENVSLSILSSESYRIIGWNDLFSWKK